MNYQLFD